MSNKTVIVVNRKRKYGLFAFLFDATLTVLTGGLWLIRVWVRETRNR